MLETLVQLVVRDKCLTLQGSIHDMDDRVDKIREFYGVRQEDMHYTQTVINSNTGIRVMFDIWFTNAWNLTIDIHTLHRITAKPIQFTTHYKGLSVAKAHSLVGYYSKLYLSD
jgi:hypothetical protein